MDGKIRSELSRLLQDPRCHNWATRLQILAEDFWSFLRSKADCGVSTHDLDDFVRLIEHRDHFDLVNMVIPELRQLADEVPNPHHRHILEATRAQRSAVAHEKSITQATFDDDLYNEEKDIYLEAELHRARLLLHQTGALEPASVEEIRDWLSRRPGGKAGQEA